MGEGKVRGFKWYGQRWLDSNVVPEPLQKVGDRDLSFEQPLYFSKAPNALDWPLPLSFECGDAETAARLAATLNALPTHEQSKRAEKLERFSQLLMAGTPIPSGAIEELVLRGSIDTEKWKREYLATFVNDCKVCGAPDGECTESCDDSSVPNDEVKPWAVTSKKESNVAKHTLVMHMAAGRVEVEAAQVSDNWMIRITTPGSDGANRTGHYPVADMSRAALEHAIEYVCGVTGAAEFYVECSLVAFKELEREMHDGLEDDHAKHLAANAKVSVDPSRVRGGDSVTIGGVTFVAKAPSFPAEISPENGVTFAGQTPTGSAALDQAKPTIPGKFDLVQALADAGMLPAGSAANRVSASLEKHWERAVKPVGQSYQIPVVFPVPQSPTPHEQFDIAVDSADHWSPRRHPTCDGFVFDNEGTGETVFIAYERLREMAKLLIAPRERTERGEAMRRRLLVAIGHASTLFHGDDGVFDSKRAIKIADDLIVELELGPGLDSLPGRALERKPASEPHAHLDEDLLAEDA